MVRWTGSVSKTLNECTLFLGWPIFLVRPVNYLLHLLQFTFSVLLYFSQRYPFPGVVPSPTRGVAHPSPLTRASLTKTQKKKEKHKKLLYMEGS
jgi:hypothetical protein